MLSLYVEPLKRQYNSYIYIHMKNTLKRNILALMLLASYWHSMAEPPASLGGWELIFNDEFDGNALDQDKWNPTYCWGHTHNHNAYCAEENVFVENGLLRIKGEAKRHPNAPASCSNGGKTYPLDYTSGAIDTNNKFRFKYGYIEGRFKMPSQLGTWPAFWMLQDGWPPEIDIFEVPHARTDNHYYLHYTNTSWYAQHGSAWDHEASFGGVHKGPDKSADFHNYGLAWSEGNLSFYFDDKLVASYNRPSEISQLTAMYIIINLAIGGWATDNGNPIQVTQDNPAFLECDWVRVWKPKELDINTTDVRLRSLETGQCMVADGNKLVLGDCNSNAARASIDEVGNGTYKISFGDKVLEIPDEKKTSGANIGLWEWNGKAHQQLFIKPKEDEQKKVVSMQFSHSGLYVLTNGENIIQDSQTNDAKSLWQIVLGNETNAEGQQRRLTAKSACMLTDNRIEIYPCWRFAQGCEITMTLYRADGALLKKETSINNGKISITTDASNQTYILKLEGDGFSEVNKIFK